LINHRLALFHHSKDRQLHLHQYGFLALAKLKKAALDAHLVSNNDFEA
jgi:hypothetical protein